MAANEKHTEPKLVRDPRPPAVPKSQVYPEGWDRALELAKGDASRIEILGPGDLVVINNY